MIANQAIQDVIAENLANASTTGYKRDVAVMQSFGDVLVGSMNGAMPSSVGTLGHGVVLNRIATDFSPGAEQSTGNNYDIALTGDAAIVVRQSGQLLLTRDGALSRSSKGLLIQSVSQAEVLDIKNKPITIPAGAKNISISENGTISADKTVIAQLQLRAVNSAVNAVKVSDNSYSVSVFKAPSPGSSVRQGFLETSNVSIVKEMVQMITGLRAYETNSKMLKTEDDATGRAITDVAKM